MVRALEWRCSPRPLRGITLLPAACKPSVRLKDGKHDSGHRRRRVHRLRGVSPPRPPGGGGGGGFGGGGGGGAGWGGAGRGAPPRGGGKRRKHHCFSSATPPP